MGYGHSFLITEALPSTIGEKKKEKKERKKKQMKIAGQPRGLVGGFGEWSVSRSCGLHPPLPTLRFSPPSPPSTPKGVQTHSCLPFSSFNYHLCLLSMFALSSTVHFIVHSGIRGIVAPCQMCALPNRWHGMLSTSANPWLGHCLTRGMLHAVSLFSMLHLAGIMITATVLVVSGCVRRFSSAFCGVMVIL